MDNVNLVSSKLQEKSSTLLPFKVFIGASLIAILLSSKYNDSQRMFPSREWASKERLEISSNTKIWFSDLGLDEKQFYAKTIAKLYNLLQDSTYITHDWLNISLLIDNSIKIIDVSWKYMLPNESIRIDQNDHSTIVQGEATPSQRDAIFNDISVGWEYVLDSQAEEKLEKHVYISGDQDKKEIDDDK